MVFYFVQRGETLVSIARRYQITVHAIVAANRLEDPNAICPGQALIIPRPGEVPSPPPGGIVHLMRPGETLFHLAERFGRSAREIMQANQIAHPEFLLAGQQVVIPEPAEPGDDWPMLGRTPGRAAATAASVEGVPVRAWQVAPEGPDRGCPSPPVLRYDRVYAGMGDGNYWCLEQESGAVRWRVEVGGAGETLVAPALYDGLAYLCGPDGSLMAVDAHTGRRVWHLALDGPAAGAPAVADGTIFVGVRTGQVWAVEAKTGAIAWRTSLEGEIAQPVALGDERLFAVTGPGRLWALEAPTGRVEWRVGADAAHPPVFAELLVIAGGVAYDPGTGEEIWRTEGAPCSPAVRVDQVIYPGRIADLFTGQSARGTEPVPPASALVVAGEAQLFFSQGPRLEAWRLGTGEPLWRLELASPGVGTPAVAPGRLFFTLEDGTLLAYRVEPR